MSDSLQTWEYLEQLQGVERLRLWRSPTSCLAVFRKRLSPLAQHFVHVLLYMPSPMPLKTIETMVRASHTRDRQMALERLKNYNIIQEINQQGGKAIALTKGFQSSYRQILEGATVGKPFGEEVELPASQTVSTDALDEYSRQQWEGILGYMVGSNNLIELQEDEEFLPPSQGVIELLKAGHLITVSGTVSRTQTASITKEGFAFVLKDINTQIWALLFLYVENAEVLQMDKIEVLSFIFFVASLTFGLAYSTSSLTQTQHQIVRDLRSLGIIYQTTPEAPHFYPTRLATTLTSSSPLELSRKSTNLGSSLQSNSHLNASHSTDPSTPAGTGFIIIETNYRVYAYTSSPLQIALLSLFVFFKSRHSNMVTGKLTKNSVQRAIQLGITSEQIISYLAAHAHPMMKRQAAIEQSEADSRAVLAAAAEDPTSARDKERVPVIPRVISDQINLWHLERDRMTAHIGYLLKDFVSQTEYADLVRYADETGVLLWRNDKMRLFFVSRVDGVKSFIAERRARQAPAS